MKKIVLAALLLLAPCAHAMPTLTGGLIQSINSDRAIYSQGATATVTVTLHNTLQSSFSGTLMANVTGRGNQIGSPITAMVNSIPAGATQTVTLSIPVPQNGNYRGYLVDIAASGSAGVVDEQTTALDVSPDWTIYPRQCWLTATWTGWPYHSPQVTSSPEANAADFNAWHCNNLQFFNMIYRWHRPYVDSMVYVNGDQLTQDQRLIMRSIGAAHNFGMGTLAYIPMYSVNSDAMQPNFLNDGSGVQLQWGMFLNYTCGGACKLTDMASFGGGSAATSSIGLMDPTNTNWQAYWAQQVSLWLKKYGFDGVFIDTYGTQPQLYNFQGHGIDYSHMLSGFTNMAVSALNAPVVLNGAASWLEQDQATNSHEAYHFREVWDHPDDITSYDGFHALSRNVWSWANRTPHNVGLDWDMGLDKVLGNQSQCQNAPLTKCTFGLPGALYLEASIMATGAHHNWLTDGDRFISNDDYPFWMTVGTTPAFIQAEYDYQTFGVAYEKLLRDNISDSTNTHSAVTGVSSNITATTGNVWQLEFHRSGFDILHLINFTSMNATQMGDVQDPNGDYPAPETRTNVAVKMYRTGTGTLGKLYIASPDTSHGKAQQLPYTTGSDSGGWFITFTVPSLKYWDMIWLENGVGSSDYAAP
ncbi:dextranase [Gluconobacter sp. Dm-74]|uniref:glycoside hydrolase family 66 protein n=1 Tax=Gluconobacter sp. Dm-74 TaxID=2799803 RepID=UPI001B8C0050|nr:glycoside hydrolase family 66 protein [Gluconobacter sp. Dm-74]MBS1091040.1 dextranase [Gluconobacter sp. Dm-74]